MFDFNHDYFGIGTLPKPVNISESKKYTTELDYHQKSSNDLRLVIPAGTTQQQFTIFES